MKRGFRLWKCFCTYMFAQTRLFSSNDRSYHEARKAKYYTTSVKLAGYEIRSQFRRIILMVKAKPWMPRITKTKRVVLMFAHIIDGSIGIFLPSGHHNCDSCVATRMRFIPLFIYLSWFLTTISAIGEYSWRWLYVKYSVALSMSLFRPKIVNRCVFAVAPCDSQSSRLPTFFFR